MNTKIIKYILSVIIVSAPLFSNGQSAAIRDSLAQANAHYTAGQFGKAATSYEGILAKGYESKELYYNLGNALYKSNNITYAILNYERALKLAPNDEDVIYNLEMAKAQVVDNIPTLPEPGFLRWWRDMIATRTTDNWALRSTISFLVFLTLLGIFLLTRVSRIKKLTFWFGLLFLTYSAFTFSFASTQKARLTGHDSAVITERSVRVKGSPSESGTELFIIHEGLTVKITDQLGEWIEIRIADGNKGWVKETAMVKI